jgi:hypothetical protein
MFLPEGRCSLAVLQAMPTGRNYLEAALEWNGLFR